jgi:xanthine dehydrogenase accessory factor
VREVFATAAEWLDQGRSFALATLVELREAKTAPIGTTVAVDARGTIAGNIGAGCHESEIIEAALETSGDGRVRRIGINLDTDDDIAGGSACGAVMELLVWRPERAFAAEARAIVEGKREVTLRIDGFVHTMPPKERLIVVGATSLAQALVAIARRAEYYTIVVDPRPAFATVERISDAHQIVRAWPQDYLPLQLDSRTALVVLSHDPKFDLPSLRCGLRSSAAYIGLLGSRRAQAARRAALRDEGVDDGVIDRIHGPVGLDLGGTVEGETAISILAEMIAERNQRAATSLSARAGSIH